MTVVRSIRAITPIGYAVACLALATAAAPPAGAATTYRVSATVNASDVAGLAVDPARHTVYLPRPFDSTLSALDESTNVVSDVLPNVQLGQPAIDVATHTVYFRGGPGFQVYDEANNRILRSITVTVPVDAFALDSAADVLYTLQTGDDTVTEIDAATGAVLATIDLGAINPLAVTVDPLTHRAYVADEDGHQIVVVDGTSHTVVGTIGLDGADPKTVDIAPDAHTLYAGGLGDDVSLVDTATDTLTAQVLTPGGVSTLAVDSAADVGYVGDADDNTVTVIDGASRRVVTTLQVGSGPDAIAVDPSTRTAYVVNSNDGTISVITSSGTGSTPQTITFTSTPPADPSVGDTYTVTATGGGSGNPVQLSATTASADVCTVADHGDSTATVTFTGLGTCVVAAHQAGDAGYAAAKLARQQIRIRGDQTITFTSTPPAHATPGSSYQATATGGASGNPVTFSAGAKAAAVCTVSTSGLVTFTGAGTCVVTARQAGSAQYRPAGRAQQRIVVRAA